MKLKSYTVWALVRKRTPGEKETKYEYKESLPMKLTTANRVLKLRNKLDKKTETKGGIEYQTSFILRKSMEKIENIWPEHSSINKDSRWDEREFEDSGVHEEEPEPFNAENLKKKYNTDPIIITPAETPGNPATITTIPI